MSSQSDNTTQSAESAAQDNTNRPVSVATLKTLMQRIQKLLTLHKDTINAQAEELDANRERIMQLEAWKTQTSGVLFTMLAVNIDAFNQAGMKDFADMFTGFQAEVDPDRFIAIYGRDPKTGELLSEEEVKRATENFTSAIAKAGTIDKALAEKKAYREHNSGGTV